MSEMSGVSVKTQKPMQSSNMFKCNVYTKNNIEFCLKK